MRALQGFLAAIVVFTRIPVRWPLPAAAFARASLHLPLLGCLIGGCQLLLLGLLTPWCPLDLGVLFTLLFPCLLSGGMHEDGLADFADGMLGGRSVEQRLAIMKDPRVGSYGVLALMAVLGLEFLALRNTASSALPRVLLLAAVLSRSLAVLLLGTLPYLNHSGSRSHGFIPSSFQGWKILVPLWPIVPVLALLPGDWTSLAFPIVLSGLFFVFRLYLKRLLEGLTGDCLGAAIKIAEACFLLLGCLLWPRAMSL